MDNVSSIIYTGNNFTLLAGLLISGVSSVITSINFFISIFYMRAVSLTLAVMNVFVWSIQIATFLLLFTLPVTGALVMLYTDINFNTLFLIQYLVLILYYISIYSGSLVIRSIYFNFTSFWCNFFSYFLAQSTIFGNQSMILLCCIAILGSTWGHHMYAVAMDSDTIAYFPATNDNFFTYRYKNL